MANYDSVSAMMNTKENMEHLVVGTKHDDDVMQFVGVDWFNFNGTPTDFKYLCQRKQFHRSWHEYRTPACLPQRCCYV